MAIKFFNADVNYSLVNREHLRTWLKHVAIKEGYSINMLNVIFCNDKFLYKMNLTYLKHNTFTDIITFDHSENSKIISGELYISIDRVRDNAKQLNVFLRDELHRVMVHGLLHLCGYSDKSSLKKGIMTKKEDHYLLLRKFL